MMAGPAARRFPDGRLHLQHGPIDLIIEAFGEPFEIELAYLAATTRFSTVLHELCAELPLLRMATEPSSSMLRGDVAQRMDRAVRPFSAEAFITPMAAVAGAVADEILAAMRATASLAKAFVNNGGDIAFFLGAGESFSIGLVDRPDRPSLFAQTTIRAADGIGGIATSGRHGRSFSLGIADAVTVLARNAAEADAAATVIANAVDLPGHPAVRRRPASALDPQSDLGDRLVTIGLGLLSPDEVEAALEAGLCLGEALQRRGLIGAAALHLSGQTLAIGYDRLILPPGASMIPPRVMERGVHAGG